MRAVIFLFILLGIGCSYQEKEPPLKSSLWINEGLKFDTVFADSNEVYSVYGSGTIVFLDANHTIKLFSNTFSKNDDTLYWGEPGVILASGRWKRSGSTVIATMRELERTFVLSTSPTDSEVIDTFALSEKFLVRNKIERFVPVKVLSSELRSFIYSDWSKFEMKNNL